MFCVTGLSGKSEVSLKVTPEEFEKYIERKGIIPAPYVARYHWIHVSDLNLFPDKEWKRLIAQAYNLVLEKLPAKIRKQIGSK